MNRKTLTLALALAMSGCATPAYAQEAPVAPKRPCAPHAEMTSLLHQKYGEVAQVLGIDATGQLMAIYVNPKTRTWTATVSSPQGMTCIVSAGTALDMLVLQGEPA